MKKTILVLNLLIAMFVFANSAFAQEIKWYKFDEGLKKATAENKVLLIDVYTEWCGWCKVMDKKTYTVPAIIQAVNKDFIAVKLNPELADEYTFKAKKYTGKLLTDLLSNNNITGYPTTLFHLPKLNKTFMEVGYLEKDRMTEALTKYAKMKRK